MQDWKLKRSSFFFISFVNFGVKFWKQDLFSKKSALNFSPGFELKGHGYLKQKYFFRSERERKREIEIARNRDLSRIIAEHKIRKREERIDSVC